MHFYTVKIALIAPDHWGENDYKEALGQLEGLHLNAKAANYVRQWVESREALDGVRVETLEK